MIQYKKLHKIVAYTVDEFVNLKKNKVKKKIICLFLYQCSLVIFSNMQAHCVNLVQLQKVDLVCEEFLKRYKY